MNNDTPSSSGDRPHSGPQMATDIRLHSSRTRRFVRSFLVISGMIFGGMLLVVVGAFFLFQGVPIENSTLNSQIERSVTALLGPRYDLQLGPTKIEFRGTSLISITSSDVKILKSGTSEMVAEIGKILVGVQPLSLFNANTKVNTVTIDGAKLDLQRLPSANSLGSASLISAKLEQNLSRLGSSLGQLQRRLAAGELDNISVKNSVISGYKFGTRSSGELAIDELSLSARTPDTLNFSLKANSGISRINAQATYARRKNSSASVVLNVEGLDAREWLRDPATATAGKRDIGYAASNSIVSTRIALEFNADNSVQQPVINVSVAPGDLRLGRKGITKINRLTLNFRVFPKLNRVILERSLVDIGEFQAQLVGGITPVDPALGLAGDIDYTLVVERAVGAPAQSGEKVHPGSMIIEGGFDRKKKLLNIDQWNLNVVGGNMVGSASLGFDSETPSLVLNGVSNGMPITALKQFWPVFLATGVRNWVREKVHGGKITRATVSTSIPGNIIGRLQFGKRIADDELVMDIDVEDARFDTFGELPPVRNASGTIKVRGMRTMVSLKKGNTYASEGKPVTVNNGSLVIADMSERPLRAEASFLAKGSVASLADITDARPLRVMKTLKMTASQWSGRGEVDMVASFPLKKKLKYGEVDWQALVRLTGAASSKPVNGRKISKANVVIDVSPQKAVISGTSTIDGIRGKVLMIEPVGKNSTTKRKRVLEARMGAAERRKIGLVMDTVITGPVDVKMEQFDGKNTADITVDLKDAVVALPWIGWRKGTGIPATAKFKMNNQKSSTRISDLKLTGQGFFMNGDLVFDKKGVKSADIPQVSLNKGDDLAVRIRRDKGVYTITANGKSFDGRVLVNKLFNEEGIGDEQGTSTFKLAANIDRVKGFGNRFANNFVLLYSVKNGWLDALSMDTRFGNNQRATIEAATQNGTTNFEIRSQNAGSALSFLNIYTRMSEGAMVSSLKRQRGQPFRGDVLIENFVITDEPRLSRLVSQQQEILERGDTIYKKSEKIKSNGVKFPRAQAAIEKGQGYLKMDGSLTGIQIGLTYNGTIFDANNRTDLRGTFMPAFGLSRIVSAIPIVGQLLSNGKDSALIGITYRLSGPLASPKLEVNPFSVVAPGIFKKVFEQRGN